MAAGAGDHLMLSRLGLGEDTAEKAGSSTLLLHESVVSQQPTDLSPTATHKHEARSMATMMLLLEIATFAWFALQVNALAFLSSGLLASAAGKVVAVWDVNACTMKHTLNHEGAVSLANHAVAHISASARGAAECSY